MTVSFTNVAGVSGSGVSGSGVVYAAGAADVATAWSAGDIGSGLSLSNSDKTVTNASGSWRGIRATNSATSGLRFFETTLDTSDLLGNAGGIILGVATSAQSLETYPGSDAAASWVWQPTASNGPFKVNGGFTAWPALGQYTPNTAGTVFGVLYNFATGTLSFYRNGVSIGDAFTGIAGTPLFPILGLYAGITSPMIGTGRFARSTWTYAPNVGEKQWGET